MKKIKSALMAEDPHCWYCGNRLARFPDDYEWDERSEGYVLWNHTGLRPVQCEHQIPKSKGGANTADNIVLSCPPCNQKKLTRTVEEYRASIEINFDLPMTFYGEVSP